jgi:hypothetical protein
MLSKALPLILILLSHQVHARREPIKCDEFKNRFEAALDRTEEVRERGMNPENPLNEIENKIPRDALFTEDCKKWFQTNFQKRYEKLKVPPEQEWEKEDPATCQEIEPMDRHLTKHNVQESANILGPQRQDYSNWCSAYVVAKLASQKLGTEISAFHVGVKAVGQKKRSGADAYLYKRSVDPNQAVEAISEQKICREDKLPSDNRNGKMFIATDDLAELNFEGILKRQKDAKNCKDFGPYTGLYKSLDLSDQMGAIFRAQNREAKVVQSVNQYCDQAGNHIQLPEFELETVKNRKIWPYNLDKLDQSLTSGKMVGITTNIEFFKSTYGPAFNGKLQGLESRSIGIPTGHVIAVVGRKYNTATGQCEYWVRNSIASTKTTHPSFVVQGQPTLLKIPRRTIKANSSEYFFLK